MEKDGWYSANIPEIRLHTQWDNWEDLMNNIKNSVQLYMDYLDEHQKSTVAKTIKHPRFYLNMDRVVHANHL
jgi:hypothetical protein